MDEKDKERERAKLSRDGEGRAPHPPTPSRDGEECATREGVGRGRFHNWKGHNSGSKASPDIIRRPFDSD